MKDGFFKVAAATPEIRVADCGYNASNIISLIGDAAAAGVKVLVFPELCITGYTCGDLFLQETLIRGAETALSRILSASADADMLIAVGVPVRYCGKLYNCAAMIKGGCLLGLVPKHHIPNYTEFYELRWFTPADESLMAETRLCGQSTMLGMRQLFAVPAACGIPELTVGAEICEDLWVASPPSESLALAGANLIVNLSASDETVCKELYRRELVASTSARLVAAYIYADAGEGESSTDLIFGAHNLIAENGQILAESRFVSGLCISEIDISKLLEERQRMNTYPASSDAGAYIRHEFRLEACETSLTRYFAPNPFVPADHGDRAQRCEEILRLASLGLKKRLMHTHAKTAVIGLSGGLDSTLALLISARAMAMCKRPVSDILAVTMPCFGTTVRTRGNAEKLAESLGATLKTVDITDSVMQHFADIGHDPADLSVTYENCQARERTQVIMDLANETGGLVIGTGDLSELALGWATYNGDHMSMYAVNASIPKTLVRHLVRYTADSLREKNPLLSDVLYDILDTPVSPELLPAVDGKISQKTEDLVGPYELHDFFLYYGMRFAFPPSKVLRLARYALGDIYDDETILKWIKIFYRRFFAQQFKRSCLPDAPKVGSVTLSPRGDWRMPSDAVAALWLEDLENCR